MYQLALTCLQALHKGLEREKEKKEYRISINFFGANEKLIRYLGTISIGLYNYSIKLECLKLVIHFLK